MPNQRGKPRVLARDRIMIIADEMMMEEKTVRQVIIRLKTDGLIASGRPIAPEMTPGNLAAILIALAAPLPSRATETLGRIGSLPRAAGFGAETAIEELAAILLAAARRDRSFDFRWGDVLIGINQPSVSMRLHLAVNSQVKSATYKDGTHYSGAATFMVIPMDVVSRLARQLIEV